MSYRIAVASSDGVNVDLHFGEAEELCIYQVDGPCDYRLIERRKVNTPDAQEASCGGCGGPGAARADLIRDCRCIVAARIGTGARKILSGRGIGVFDVVMPLGTAVDRISGYYDLLDRHVGLKDFSEEFPA